VLIVCKKGILDPKTPANRETGYPGQAMQFVAAGQKNSNLSVYTGIKKYFRRLQKKLRRNLAEI
jgi:hypothetical protein